MAAKNKITIDLGKFSFIQRLVTRSTQRISKIWNLIPTYVPIYNILS